MAVACRMHWPRSAHIFSVRRNKDKSRKTKTENEKKLYALAKLKRITFNWYCSHKTVKFSSLEHSFIVLWNTNVNCVWSFCLLCAFAAAAVWHTIMEFRPNAKPNNALQMIRPVATFRCTSAHCTIQSVWLVGVCDYARNKFGIHANAIRLLQNLWTFRDFIAYFPFNGTLIRPFSRSIPFFSFARTFTENVYKCKGKSWHVICLLILKHQWIIVVYTQSRICAHA